MDGIQFAHMRKGAAFVSGDNPMLSLLKQTAIDVFHRVRSRPALLSVLLISALLYTCTVFYGLPQELHPDEYLFVDSAIEMLQTGSLDPAWYGVPAQSLIYILAIIIALIAVVGTLFGAFSSPADAGNLFIADPTVFYVAGRLVSVAFAVVSLWLTDRLIRAFDVTSHWRWIGLVLLALTAVFAEYAAIIRMDMMQICFSLAAILLNVKALRSDEPSRYLIFAGACVGLAVTSKYPGIVAAVPVMMAAFLLARNKVWTWLKAFWVLYLAGLASVAAAFLTGPYMFINFATVLRDVMFEARDYHLGATGAGFLDQVSFYLFDIIPAQMSIVGLVFGGVGLCMLSLEKRQGGFVFGVAAAYLVFLSSLAVQWERWGLPLLPLFAVGIAVSGDRAERVLSVRMQRAAFLRVVPTVVIALGIAQTASKTLPVTWAKTQNNDTRVIALDWINDHLPKQSRVLSESYTPALDATDFTVFVPRFDPDIVTWSSQSRRHRPYGFYGDLSSNWEGDSDAFMDRVNRLEIDYIIMSDYFFLRYEREGRESAQLSLNIYDAIFEHFVVEKEFETSSLSLGSRILVLKRADRASMHSD